MSEALRRIAAHRPLTAARERGRGLRYVLLDVFTSRPLTGNQLAVFVDAPDLAGPVMQAIAAELKLSETVFVLAAREGGDARLRIFTPRAELPFAGHPVLGAAAVVAGALGSASLVLETGSGPVALEIQKPRGRVLSASMAQPLPSVEPFAAADELLGALGLESSILPVEEYCNGPRHVFVEAGSRRAVAELRPDLAALREIVGEAGVSCFAGAGDAYKTRMFAPGLGVPEDPATGSAAGPLALHLARHGRIGFGEEIEISQGKEIGRPSVLFAAAFGSADRPEKLVVGGSAVVVAEGSYWIG